SQVICGLDRKPARIVCPDPRWMALHNSWLSKQTKRRSDKRKKDAEQGRRLMAAVKEHMPQFPLDAAFETAIPAELADIYTELTAEA
ncbi:MAG: hypothetical protein JNN20_06845, partial [Betaproteobacteria bacterium]|nr:hypothetical protein [Betaproteobacteria bacterium]